MTDHSDLVVRTESLSKTFRTGLRRRSVQAVIDLNLEVRKGEVFGLLGPNGSGKTTTTKLLLGLLFPTRGKAWVLGKPAGDVPTKQRIGFLPEESYLYRFLNAEETLEFYGELLGMSRPRRRSRAAELIDLVGLKAARKRPLKEYSKGMARRIGLAQALMNDPDFIVLDEPTSGLDPIGTREFKDFILQLKQRGKTLLLCSHLLADVQDVCDRIAIMHLGRLLLQGDVRSLLEIKDIVEMRFRNLSESARMRMREVAESADGKFLGVAHPSTTLEDLFLRTIRETDVSAKR